MNEEQSKAQEKANAAKAIKDECEADLAEVGVLIQPVCWLCKCRAVW